MARDRFSFVNVEVQATKRVRALRLMQRGEGLHHLHECVNVRTLQNHLTVLGIPVSMYHRVSMIPLQSRETRKSL
jgi:hypothetical protein